MDANSLPYGSVFGRLYEGEVLVAVDIDGQRGFATSVRCGLAISHEKVYCGSCAIRVGKKRLVFGIVELVVDIVIPGYIYQLVG